MNKIITISRQFGSGGRELGKRLAEQLNIGYYDKEIISQISQKTDLAVSYVQQVIENEPINYYPITIGRSFYDASGPIFESKDPIFEQNNAIYAEQNNVIKELAEKSDCVIVGRCADYILSEMKPIRIFVYADDETRIKRCRSYAPEHEKLSDKELFAHMNSIDKNREKYYRFFTGKKWGELENFDVCVNTTSIPIKTAAEAIAELVRQL